MRTLGNRLGILILLGLAIAVGQGPAAADPQDKSSPAPKQDDTTAQDFAQPREGQTPDLGSPLVDQVQQLTRLDPNYPVWADKQNKQVVLLGAVCKQYGPLELFACLLGSKEYESIVAVETTARLVQTALLAVGAEPGSPVKYEPEFSPPRGTPVEITVIWKDKDGKRHTARAQEWVRKVDTTQPMEQHWVFAGGLFGRDPQSGKEVFAADMTGDLICVSNFPDAVLDVSTRSTTTDTELLFEAFAERIPPRGTPVTLILKPQVK